MNAGEAFICAGVESMTRVPMTGFNPMPNPVLHGNMPGAYMSMGETAENVGRKYSIDRDEQEKFALKSQQKAASAQADGRLASEIVPVNTNETDIDQDGCLRPETTLEGLADLKLAFDQNGTVTAGTSSPLTDGAAAVLVCSLDYAERNHLNPLARIVSTAVAGCDPETMGLGPIFASRKALERAGIKADALDVIEINEAFATQAIACIRDLNLAEEQINQDGGAIALGHPLGATGARITGKAASILAREGGRFALSTQCIGGGQGIATVMETV